MTSDSGGASSYRLDYDRVDWRFVARLLDQNSLRLSRTRQGVVSTAVSPRKRPLLLTGAALRQRVAANERRSARLIYETRSDPPPRDGAAALDLLWTLADRANEGLLPAGKLRSWLAASPRAAELGSFAPVARLAPEELPGALAHFGEVIWQRWAELASDPVPLAGWAEWMLNCGPLHPFYDGCGRISRAFGALLLVRAAHRLPYHENQRDYYEHGDRGIEVFTAYLRQRIAASADRIASRALPAP